MLFYNVFGKKSSVLNKKTPFYGDETKTARNGVVFKNVKQSGEADFCRTEKNRDNLWGCPGYIYRTILF